MRNDIDKKVKSSGNKDLTKLDLIEEKIILSIEKSARSESKLITTVSSGFNILIPCSMFFVHSTAKASVLLGSSITSFALGSISMALNIYSLVNNFRDRKLFKTAELEEKRKQELIKENRNKLKVICCDILCDIMFLSAAIASILLLGYSTTIPLLVVGCILMLASMCISCYHKWEQFKSLSSEETEQIKDKYKEKIQESLVYRIVSKVFPETLLLVNLHQEEKSQQMKEELKSIKQLLRDKKSEVEREQNNKTTCSSGEEKNNKEKEGKIAQNSSDIKVKEPFPQEEKPQQMKEELKTTKHLLRDKKSEVDRGQNNKMICNREEERNNKEKENKIGQIFSDVKIQDVFLQNSIICQ